jgi:hypothetical protein
MLSKIRGQKMPNDLSAELASSRGIVRFAYEVQRVGGEVLPDHIGNLATKNRKEFMAKGCERYVTVRTKGSFEFLIQRHGRPLAGS